MSHPKPSSWLRGLISLLMTSNIIAFASMAFLTSCGKSKPAQPTVTAEKEVKNPWPAAASAIRKEPELAVCRRVLNELNAATPSLGAADQPQPLLSDVAATVRDKLRIVDPAEVTELQASAFTPLDSHYLAECLYLRDVARSLDLAGASTEEKAKLAFEFVCRQILLQPKGPPLPVSETLRRGSGTGLDRAYVFAALGHQLDLDVYFIGQVGASDWLSTHVPAGRDVAKGPFWAVGVRNSYAKNAKTPAESETEILLFDPWVGQPIPGPKPDRIATLAQARTDPATAKVWLENRDFAWDVGASDLRAAEVYLPVPLSAAAGRTRLLEQRLKTETGVRLVIDVIARLAEATAAGKGATARVWSPPQDPFCTTRVLRAYLPTTDGGIDLVSLEAVRFGRVPRKTLFLPPPRLVRAAPEAVELLWEQAAISYRESFLKPPTPRERFQRGFFHEANQTLMKLRDDFEGRAARVRADATNTQTAQEFILKTEQFFSSEIVAMRSNRSAFPQNVVNARISEFFRNQQAGVAAILDGPFCQAARAEVLYLLSLSTHEWAERFQYAFERSERRLASASVEDRAAATAARDRARQESRDKWELARHWWELYAPLAASQEGDFPGRAAHTRKLEARAVEMSR